MTKEKPKIEAIYPLSTIQQGLLFHHLSEDEDQGFLQVQCKLEGELNSDILKKAWSIAVQQHEIMRASVHWKKVERPVIIIRPEKEIDWLFLDWTPNSEVQITKDLKNFKVARKSESGNLEKNPLSKITIIKTEADKYVFLWDCHHLLLDGWSSTIILRDAFKCYDALVNSENVELATIPSYKAYNSWLQKYDFSEALEFWNETLGSLKESSLINKSSNQLNESTKHFVSQISSEIREKLEELAKQNKITLNSVFQGIWSLLLSKYLQSTDVVFGNTVSGRSVPFSGIDIMAGMFANTLPVRAQFSEEKSIAHLFLQIQQQQQKARNFEFSTMEQIMTWAKLDFETSFFDTLFVFENFPWQTIESGNLKVKDFNSGITTTYPLTAIFKINNTIEFDLLINPEAVNEKVAEWFLNSFSKLIDQLIITDWEKETLTSITEDLEASPESKETSVEKTKNIKDETERTAYVAPDNAIELQLIEIWEQILGVYPISVTDNFFHLGGKSLTAVKLFSLIESRMGVKLQPTILLENPTIKKIAEVIGSDVNKVSWKYIVPIKTKGEKNPIFCIHAGGGHVFFYKNLADCVTSRPVYALQPTGISSKEKKHQSIEAMAKDYADEILSIQETGTLNILVYCFSTGVGVEIASYLKSKNREVNIIVADTIAEHRLLLDKSRLSIRVTAFVKRLLNNPFKALGDMIGYRIFFYLKPIHIKLFGSKEAKDTEDMRLHLVTLFNKYQWKTKADKVSLISTKKIDNRFNKAVLQSWEKVMTNKENISFQEIEAKHPVMFDFPDVENTAKAVENAMID